MALAQIGYEAVGDAKLKKRGSSAKVSKPRGTLGNVEDASETPAAAPAAGTESLTRRELKIFVVLRAHKSRLNDAVRGATNAEDAARQVQAIVGVADTTVLADRSLWMNAFGGVTTEDSMKILAKQLDLRGYIKHGRVLELRDAPSSEPDAPSGHAGVQADAEAELTALTELVEVMGTALINHEGGNAWTRYDQAISNGLTNSEGARNVFGRELEAMFGIRQTDLFNNFDLFRVGLDPEYITRRGLRELVLKLVQLGYRARNNKFVR